jgi:aminopeptidase N
MPEESSTLELGTGYSLTKFKEMSSVQTYLIAFAVSDFTFIENATVVPPQRVFAKPQSIDNGEGDVALEESPGIMQKLEDYYGIKYALPKMDQIALPNFAAGAVR